VWAFSLGVTIVIALVYYVLNQIPALDNLGRRKRSVKNQVLEDFFANLQRLTIVHEKSDKEDEPDVYSFATRLEVEDE
jgi:H+-transporting ATPase